MTENKISCARKGYPSRVVCLSEETIEFLYALGLGELVVGVTTYAKRPPEAAVKPVVSSFIKADFQKILDLQPDLVLTFSDLQADITKELILKGLPVYNSNPRTLDEIIGNLRQVGALVGYAREADALCQTYEKRLSDFQKRATQSKQKPRVYFEEWDDPMISGIAWVSELIELAGGENLFACKAHGKLAQDRFVTTEEVIAGDPEIIFASWCGKKFNEKKFRARPGFNTISAVRENRIYEIDSTIILQPGPACIMDGLDILQNYLDDLQ